METKLLYQTLDKVEADAVVVVMFEDDPAPPDLKFASEWIEGMREPGEFSGKSEEMAVLHQPPGFAPSGWWWRAEANALLSIRLRCGNPPGQWFVHSSRRA